MNQYTEEEKLLLLNMWKVGRVQQYSPVRRGFLTRRFTVGNRPTAFPTLKI